MKDMKKMSIRFVAILLAVALCFGCAGSVFAEEAEEYAPAPEAIAETAPEPEPVPAPVVEEETSAPAAVEEETAAPEPEPEIIPETQPEPVQEAETVPEPVVLPDENVQDEAAAEAAEPVSEKLLWDEELKLDHLYRGSLTDEKPVLVLRLEIRKKLQTVRLTTEHLAVKLTVADLDGTFKQVFKPVIQEKKYLPLDETVELRRGVYLITVESAEDGEKGAFNLLAAVLPEETDEVEAAEPEAAQQAEPMAEELPALSAIAEDATDEDEAEVEEVIVEAIESDEEPEMTEVSETLVTPEIAETADAVDPTAAEGFTAADKLETAETAELIESAAPVETAEETAADEADVVEETAAALPVADENDPAELTAREPKAPPTVLIESYVEEISQAGPSAVILLRVSVTNAEGPYAIQWQYTPDGGDTIIDVPNGNGPEYRYVLDSETAQYGWRVMVTMLPEETNAEAVAP